MGIALERSPTLRHAGPVVAGRPRAPAQVAQGVLAGPAFGRHRGGIRPGRALRAGPPVSGPGRAHPGRPGAPARVRARVRQPRRRAHGGAGPGASRGRRGPHPAQRRRRSLKMVVKKGETVVLASTRKGLFVAHSKDRRRWKIEGPSFEGVEVKHALLAPDGRSVLAAVNSYHWGATVQRSTSFGARWAKHADQPRYAEGSGLSMKAVWHVEQAPDGAIYAGVEPAGLFRSDDGGKTWAGVEGLNAR